MELALIAEADARRDIGGPRAAAKQHAGTRDPDVGEEAALNAFTVKLAGELRDTSIKVNSACPGFVATDLNQRRGTRTVEQGASIAVRLATLPPDGPTGGFHDDDGVVIW